MPDSTKRPLKVFLCHSSGDKPIVRALYRQLMDEGWVDVWLDEMKLLPGHEWDIEIEKAVEEADIVIVFLSTRSVDKEGYVQKELRFVLNIADEKPEGLIFVIPLRLDDCVVPRRLRHWQWVDYFPKNQRKFAYQRLLESLKMRARKLGLTHLSTVVEAQPPVVNIPVKPPASHAQFAPPEIAEKPDEKIVSRLASEPEEAIPPLLHKEVKEERPTAKLPPVITPPKAGVKEPLPKINFRLFGIAGFILIALIISVLGGNYLIQYLPVSTTSTSTNRPPTKTPVVTVTLEPPIATPTLGIGSSMTSEKDGMTLLYVPAGEFTMGSESGNSDEQPVHTIYLDAFWIDQTEVTNAMYAKCVLADECDQPGSVSSSTRQVYFGNSEFDNYPVINVSWEDAKTYCLWADRRLLTEAQWEKAARGTDQRVYPWGDSIDCSLANYWGKENSCVGDTTEVGKYPNAASPYGTLDMAGNVWEWVNDWYAETYYSNSPTSNPLGPDSGQDRVMRGGAWSYPGNYIRSASRIMYIPLESHNYIGFRCSHSP